MNLFKFLDRGSDRKQRPQRVPRPRPVARPPTFRPRLESLEDRLVPATLMVTNTNDSGVGSLRYEVGVANTGDTINFDPTLVGGKTINLLTPIKFGVNGLGQPNGVTNVTIDGLTANVTISGNNTTRMFEVVAGNDTINNLSLTAGNGTDGQGNAANGGAILVDKGAGLYLGADTFTGNQTTGNGTSGGAIENDGTTTVADSNFTSNISLKYGGAIENTGQLTVSNFGDTPSTFTNNRATNEGGAIDSNGQGAGQLTVNNSNFYGNSAGIGGAISTNDNTQLSGDTFGGIQAGQPNLAIGLVGYGGAVSASGGVHGTTQLTVLNSTFIKNQVTGNSGNGGAISSSLVTDVETSTFSNNSAPSYGGAIDYDINNQNDPATPWSSTLTVNQDSFMNNSAQYGGGVSAYANENAGFVRATVQDSTFAYNTAQANGMGWGAGLSVKDTTTGTGSTDAVLINDTFFQNQSDNVGGGLAVYGSAAGTGQNTMELISLTVNQNKAVNGGGGLYVDTAQNVFIDNSILDGNFVTQAGYNGPLDVTLANGATLSPKEGYNLVGTSDAAMFKNNDQISNTTGLANALAPNGAKPGYPMTLALTAVNGANSPGYENGDPALAGKPSPQNQDARGFTRQANKVSIGAEDPDAT